MADMTQVTYCGLYCGLCAQRNRIPQRAERLRESMHKEGWHQWGNAFPGFQEFWSFLNRLAESESRCSCRGGMCGPPFCGIRKCAQQKGIEVCPFCNEYPCDRILGVAKGYVTMLADGKRMKATGIEAWIAEQEERRKTGFAYVDIRCQPYEIPDK
jgi:hypothetical protein